MSSKQLMERAFLALDAQRYEEVTTLMKEVVERGGILQGKEQYVFSAGFQMVVGAKRNSLKRLSLYPVAAANYKIFKDYKRLIKQELCQVCDCIIKLLDKYLIPNAKNIEARAFYLRLRGDHYRYLISAFTNRPINDLKREATKSYEEAYDIALNLLAARNVNRLGIVLNFSVFCHEVLNDTSKGINIAQEAVADLRIGDLQNVFEEEILSKHLMNLGNWMPDEDST